ncbi:glycosyltransferase family 10 domain-containing protein [Parasedimentitalea marina]|nr:glycosyltransferase family 10 [Parasedimentitalea marina]
MKAKRGMPQDNPTVGILAPAAKLGFVPHLYPLDKLHWPLGQPERLLGKQLKDLGRKDHLLLPPRSTSYFRPSFGTRAKVSVMVLEPRIVQERHIQKLLRFHWRFHKVLAAVEDDLIAHIPNGVFFPFGSTWVDNVDSLDLTKSRMTSLIASAKRSQPGHLVRHNIVDWARANEMDLVALGGGYHPFENKHEGLAPYRFSVVIENSNETNYFTEKLIDTILCGCVPIYLGCPNIDRFFDTSGMIICKDENDIRHAVENASEQLYQSKLPALQAIRDKAAHWGDLEGRAARALLASDA